MDMLALLSLYFSQYRIRRRIDGKTDVFGYWLSVIGYLFNKECNHFNFSNHRYEPEAISNYDYTASAVGIPDSQGTPT
jgi:hypothetical protein